MLGKRAGESVQPLEDFNRSNKQHKNEFGIESQMQIADDAAIYTSDARAMGP